MTPERWLEIRKVFDSLVELSDTEQGAALEREGARDPELRREVETLLRAHARSPSQFLASPPFGDDAADEGVLAVLPQQLGPWLVERKLGRGAMGTVFVATMTEDRPWACAGEQVALKVLPAAP